MKYKIAVKGIGIILTILFTAGCWDRREINDLNFLTDVAVDQGKHKKFSVTFQWFNPAASSMGGKATPQSAVSYYTIEGDSIKETETELTKLSPRIPVYNHMQFFVIGSELAKKGINEIIDRFGREVQFRRSKYILVAEEKGENILHASTPFEMPATDIREILERTNQSSEYSLVNYNDFMQYFTDAELLSFLPLVHIKPSMGIKGASENLGKGILVIEGMAFFEKDHLISRLNGNETKAWLYTQGKIKKGTDLQYSGNDQETAVFQTLNQSRKLDIDLSSYPIKVTLKIRTSGIISETTGNMDLEQSELLKKVSHQLELTIRMQINQFINKSQEEKKDMLFVGREIRAHYPNRWNEMKGDWNNIYSSIQFRTEVKVKIKHVGLFRSHLARK